MSADNQLSQTSQENLAADEEFNLLQTDPHAFAIKFNGRLPSIAPNLSISKEGYVVDESALKPDEWKLIHGMFVPLKIVDKDSGYVSGYLDNQKEINQKHKLDVRRFPAVVNTRDGYTNEFIFGTIFPDDLDKKIGKLKKEFDTIFNNLTLDRQTQFITGVAKIMAIFAKLSYKDRDKAPSHEETHIG